MTPLSLTDHQLRAIKRAATRVPVKARDEFLQAVARQLAGEPSDAAVQAAIDVQLTLGRTPEFVCDTSPRKETVP
jgi:hypothetical protein